MEKYNIDPQNYMVKISKKAISYKGTSAGLRKSKKNKKYLLFTVLIKNR